MKDEGFQLPTPSAERVLQCVERLLEWLSEKENKEAVSFFLLVIFWQLEQLLFDLSLAQSGREQMCKCGNAITSFTHPKDL